MKIDADGWVKFGHHLGIAVTAPVEIDLAGVKARFSALLPQFGGPQGMIIDANWSTIEAHKSALLAAGYGYSCVGARDPADLDDAEALAASREMLAIWGWSSASPQPEWLIA